MISGFAFAETSHSNAIEKKDLRMCAPEDMQYVSFTTTCGRPAVASGCTTEDLIADAVSWESFLCAQP